jgi:hypothetical protein
MGSRLGYQGRYVGDKRRQFINLPLTLEQALQVSDHLPVWAEFSAYESAAPGRVAGRPGTAATVTSPVPR